MKFKDLKIGEKFGVWGDQHINYPSPMWCICIKLDEQTGQEIGGMRFLMNPNDEIHQED